MQLYWIVFAVLLASLSTSASAATYRVNVDASFEFFRLDDYLLNNGDESTYFISSPDDPVLENYPKPLFVKSAYRDSGSLTLTKTFFSDGDIGYVPSKCTGIFLIACGFSGPMFPLEGELSKEGFDLRRADTFGGVFLSSDGGFVTPGGGELWAATDDDYGWTNSRGVHFVSNGESLVYSIKDYEISVVPLSGSASFALIGLGMLIAAGHRRRFKASA